MKPNNGASGAMASTGANGATVFTNVNANAAAKAANNAAAEKAKHNAEITQAPLDGGRRRTKRAKKVQKGGKISKGASKWNQFVMRTFKEMRKKNKTVKLMDAMKECSKQKKKGVKY
jgi:ribosomal protein S10